MQSLLDGIDWLEELGLDLDLIDVGRGTLRVEDLDAPIVAGGWIPNLALWRAIGGTVSYDDAPDAFVPQNGPDWLTVVGRAPGKKLPPHEAAWIFAGEDSEAFIDLQRDQTVADLKSALDAGLTSVEHVKRATYIGTAIDRDGRAALLRARS